MADFKAKLAEQEVINQKKDIQIRELDKKTKNVKVDQEEVNKLQKLLKTAQNEKKDAIASLKSAELKLQSHEQVENELTQLKRDIQDKDDSVK